MASMQLGSRRRHAHARVCVGMATTSSAAMAADLPGDFELAEQSSTDLARDWERDAGMRRRAHRLEFAAHLQLDTFWHMIDYVFATLEHAVISAGSRCAWQHVCGAQVVFTGSRVTRDTIKENVYLFSCAYRHLAHRVGVDTVEVHIRSFFDIMHIDHGITSTFPTYHEGMWQDTFLWSCM